MEAWKTNPPCSEDLAHADGHSEFLFPVGRSQRAASKIEVSGYVHSFGTAPRRLADWPPLLRANACNLIPPFYAVRSRRERFSSSPAASDDGGGVASWRTRETKEFAVHCKPSPHMIDLTGIHHKICGKATVPRDHGQATKH